MRNLFFHIPKTGGSSVRKALMDTGQYNNWMRGHWTASQIKARSKMHGLEYGELFTVVRNPYDRFASNFFHVRNRQSRCSSHYTHFNRLSFDEYTHRFLADWDSIEMIDNYHHFLPQRTYFDTDDYVRVFRTEDLAQINDYIGVRLTNENVGTYKDSYEKLYTPKLRRLVREFYHEDFEKFGY